MTLNSNRKYLFLSAILFGFSQPGNGLGLLLFIAFIPLFHYWVHSSRTLFQRAIDAMYFGLLFSFIALYWIAFSSFAGFLGSAVIISLRFVLLFLIQDLLIKRNRNYLILFIPLFVCSEYAYQLSDLDFPWYVAAYALTDFPFLLQWAELGGQWILSFFALGINYFFFESFRTYQSGINKKVLIYACITVIAFILGNLILYLHYEPLQIQRIKIALLQPNIDPFKKWDQNYRQETMKLTFDQHFQAIADSVNLIVWPETSLPYYIRRYESMITNFMSMSQSNSIDFLIGTLDYEEHENSRYDFNASICFLHRDSMPHYYHKQKLVPVIEKEIFPTVLSFINNLPGMAGFTKGNESKVYHSLQNGKSYRFAGLICIESNYPELVSEHKLKGAQFVNIITNDGWFYPHYAFLTPLFDALNLDPHIPSKGALQHFAIAKMRAVENRIPICRSANTGVSGIIGPKGETLIQTLQYQSDIVIHDLIIEEKSRLTIYNKYPLLTVYLCVTFIVFTLFNIEFLSKN